MTATTRVSAAALGALIVLGSGLLWLGVPVACAWLASQVVRDGVGAILLSLLLIPVAMVVGGWLLYRAGARYERLRGRPPRPASPPAWRSSLGEERASARRQRAGRPLIDVAMTVSAVSALVVMAVWFFFFAELRLSPFP
jgi:hypothetical protein